MKACDYRPHERLHISNHAYSPKHVNNIALYLANSNTVQLPYGFPQISQNDAASWIISKFGHDPYIIERAERIVRSNYAGKQQLFRKGRKVGSRNASAGDGLDDVLGASDAVAASDSVPTETRTSEAPTLPTVDLSAYALKTELYRISDALTSAMKGYSETEFNRVAREINALKDHVAAITDNRPTIVTLERRELPSIELGVQHKHFSDLLAMCNARTREGYHLNVWIYGPAGTGKTTAAKYVATALTPGRFFALPALETGFQVLGYNDANGNYVSTLFRECWQNGGTIILDEVDSYSPSAALALNGALANGIASFPDGMVPRHKDCIIIAGANTTGLGGTMEYVGRMKQDAAFLDRWAPLDWPLDEGLENSLCVNTNWLAIVRYCRAQVIVKQIKGAMITPRATIYGEALLAAGVSLDRVIASTLKKGMSDAQWTMIAPPNHLLTACV